MSEVRRHGRRNARTRLGAGRGGVGRPVPGAPVRTPVTPVVARVAPGSRR